MTDDLSLPRRYRAAPRLGEHRRDALLAALAELLETRPLARIGIGEITERAGVTRSGFYFYFPSKAAAVAGLLEDIYSALLDASGRWHGAEPDAVAGWELLWQGFDAVVSYTRERAHLLVAVLDAAGADREVGDVWEGWMRDLAERVAAKIARDRAAGVAPPGADAEALGLALVAMNVRALESEARALQRGEKARDDLTEALAQIWQRAIYLGDRGTS